VGDARARRGDCGKGSRAFHAQRFHTMDAQPAGRCCETYKFSSFLLTLEIRRFIPAYVRRKSTMRGNGMPLFGYARVSTRDQNLAAQDAELMAAGCAKVFKEKVSGTKTDRPELAKVIGRLEPGDVLVITRLD